MLSSQARLRSHMNPSQLCLRESQFALTHMNQPGSLVENTLLPRLREPFILENHKCKSLQGQPKTVSSVYES